METIDHELQRRKSQPAVRHKRNQTLRISIRMFESNPVGTRGYSSKTSKNRQRRERELAENNKTEKPNQSLPCLGERWEGSRARVGGKRKKRQRKVEKKKAHTLLCHPEGSRFLGKKWRSGASLFVCKQRPREMETPLDVQVKEDEYLWWDVVTKNLVSRGKVMERSCRKTERNR